MYKETSPPQTENTPEPPKVPSSSQEGALGRDKSRGTLQRWETKGAEGFYPHPAKALKRKELKSPALEGPKGSKETSLSSVN